MSSNFKKVSYRKCGCLGFFLVFSLFCFIIDFILFWVFCLFYFSFQECIRLPLERGFVF